MVCCNERVAIQISTGTPRKLFESVSIPVAAISDELLDILVTGTRLTSSFAELPFQERAGSEGSGRRVNTWGVKHCKLRLEAPVSGSGAAWRRVAVSQMQPVRLASRACRSSRTVVSVSFWMNRCQCALRRRYVPATPSNVSLTEALSNSIKCFTDKLMSFSADSDTIFQCVFTVRCTHYTLSISKGALLG